MSKSFTSLAAVLVMAASSASHAQESISEAVEGLTSHQGFLTSHVDSSDGRVLIELAPQDDGSLGRMIYTARLTSGLGSNPVGLDRGLGSSSEILRFTRVNDQVFAEFENTGYVALGAGPEEADATRQSLSLIHI